MIDIRQLFPLVKQAFPHVPDARLLQQMEAFAQQRPNLTNEQAIQALQEAVQHPAVQAKIKAATQPKPLFQGLVNNLPQGVAHGPIR
jgi:hypothetical protein